MPLRADMGVKEPLVAVQIFTYTLIGAWIVGTLLASHAPETDRPCVKIDRQSKTLQSGIYMPRDGGDEHIELIPAFTWDCPDCGRNNFCRAIAIETSPEDAYVLEPTNVTCHACGNDFDTLSYGQDDKDLPQD
tara:strand:- start:2436 stop:2834 length:399 start_codon:yes stop_codon:yes gene_type:complete